MTLDDSALDFFEGAVRVLDERGLIDPRRVVLSGFSGSSTTTAYSLTQSNRFTAAIVTTQGSRDAILCYLNSNLRLCRGVAKRYGYELPWDSRTGMLASSPAWNVEKIRTPLLMQLPEVEYLGAMQLYSAMMDYGRGVEVYVFPESYHFKHRPRHRLAVYDRNVDWIDFWLRDRENARAQTAGQYERWRAMRESQCLMSGSEAGKVPPPWYCGR
jgi:dipeptidyl aminopeptidase/acylaminoacyl peptidase